jgi:glycosyltransferase involved in cell wall biosynthesis
LVTYRASHTTEQVWQPRRGVPVIASASSLAVTSARKLLSAFRDHPGRRGPMHIAILADPLLRYSAGQAVGLVEVGAKVTLYYVDRLREFGDTTSERARILDEVNSHGVDVVRLDRRRLARTVGQTRALLRDLRARKVTGLIAQAHFDPRYAFASLRLPTVLVLHDPRPHSGDSDTPRWPMPLVARFAEATASCLMIHSDRLAPQIRQFLRQVPTIVVPHGATMAPAPVRRPRSPVALVAGRLFAYKGVDWALDAFPAVRRRVPDARLIVAGRGPVADEARRRGLEGVAIEDGYVSDARMEQLLEQASVLLLPYRDATQSGMGLLAVGRGIPCVVTPQGALPDLLGRLGDDLLWPTSDLGDLADAVVAALEKDDAFRTAIYDRAAKLFTWSVVGETLLSQLVPFEFGMRPGAERSHALLELSR